VSTVASAQQGVAELMAAVEQHQAYLESTGTGRARAEARLKDEAADLVGEWARAQARRLLEEDGDLAARLQRDRSPYATAEEILTQDGANLVPHERNRE
jgi:LAO/AO transport system kinase